VHFTACGDIGSVSSALIVLVVSVVLYISVSVVVGSTGDEGNVRIVTKGTQRGLY
jgi:hypothetical protein